jgi:hypothetical protein
VNTKAGGIRTSFYVEHCLRTPIVTAQCKTAFEASAAAMRDSKKRCFYVPPLAEADLIGFDYGDRWLMRLFHGQGGINGEDEVSRMRVRALGRTKDERQHSG